MWTIKCQTCRISSKLRSSKSPHFSRIRKQSRAKVPKATVRRHWITSRNLKRTCMAASTVRWLLSNSTHLQTWEALIHSTTVVVTGPKMASNSSNMWSSLLLILSSSRLLLKVKEPRLSTSQTVLMQIIKLKKTATIVTEMAKTLDRPLPTWPATRVNPVRTRLSRWKVETMSNVQITIRIDSWINTTPSPMAHLVTTWSKMESITYSSKWCRRTASRSRPRTTVPWRETARNRGSLTVNQYQVIKTCLIQTPSVLRWQACLSLEMTFIKQWEEVAPGEATPALLTVLLLRTTRTIQVSSRSMMKKLTKWTTALLSTTIITFTKHQIWPTSEAVPESTKATCSAGTRTSSTTLATEWTPATAMEANSSAEDSRANTDTTEEERREETGSQVTTSATKTTTQEQS